MSNFFVGITTTLSAGITSTSSSISISDATASGLNIGDYIMVNDEMMRIKNTSINEVFRGVFGTKSTNHISGTQIKKVRVVPVESRRNSLIRVRTRHLNTLDLVKVTTLLLYQRNKRRFYLQKIVS